jgi:hypothetical protein
VESCDAWWANRAWPRLAQPGEGIGVGTHGGAAMPRRRDATAPRAADPAALDGFRARNKTAAASSRYPRRAAGLVLQRQAVARRTFPAEEVPSSVGGEPRRTLAAARAAGGVRSAQPVLCWRLPAVRAPFAAASGTAAGCHHSRATAVCPQQKSVPKTNQLTYSLCLSLHCRGAGCHLCDRPVRNATRNPPCSLPETSSSLFPSQTSNQNRLTHFHKSCGSSHNRLED